MDAVTDDAFEAEVLRSPGPVVVDFWAPWCRPCKAVETILEHFEREHGDRIRFLKVNVDESPVFASRYGVLALPTTLLFEGGVVQDRVTGARNRTYYERAWARWLAPG